MPNPSPSDDDQALKRTLVEELCRVTHLCWREKRAREGWQYGIKHDDTSRTHDAIVPFDELTKRDLHVLGVAVKAEEVERFLANIVEYERGPERLFMIEDMRQGMRVGMSKSDGSFDDSEILGAVTGWDADADTGELESIEVRWDDGDTMRYHPEVRELRRIDD